MTRIAVVRKERCNPNGCGGHLCMKLCPVNRQGKECITKDPDDNKVKIDENEKHMVSASFISNDSTVINAIWINNSAILNTSSKSDRAKYNSNTIHSNAENYSIRKYCLSQ